MNLTPSTKTIYTAVGGAIVTLISFALTLTTGLELPAEVGAALATIVTAIIALTVPARQGKYVSEALVNDVQDLDPQQAIEVDYDPQTDTVSDPTTLEHVEDDAL